MNEQEIQSLVQQQIKEALAVYSQQNQYGLSNIPTHAHTGSDSAQIDPKNLLGYQVLTAAPTYSAPNGTIILSNVGGVRRIWTRIANAWYSVVVA